MNLHASARWSGVRHLLVGLCGVVLCSACAAPFRAQPGVINFEVSNRVFADGSGDLIVCPGALQASVSTADMLLFQSPRLAVGERDPATGTGHRPAPPQLTQGSPLTIEVRCFDAASELSYQRYDGIVAYPVQSEGGGFLGITGSEARSNCLAPSEMSGDPMPLVCVVTNLFRGFED
jgi:hypothetical protein